MYTRGRRRRWKNNGPGTDGTVGAGLQIVIDFLADSFHDRRQKAGFRENPDGFIRSQAVVNGFGKVAGGAGKDGF